MINIAIAILGCAAAAYTDLKFGKIPNWIAALLLIAGAVYTALLPAPLIPIIFAAATLILGYILCMVGLGGGDVKLLVAISLLIPFYPHLQFPFILAVFITALCLSTAYKLHMKKKQTHFALFILLAVLINLFFDSLIFISSAVK